MYIREDEYSVCQCVLFFNKNAININTNLKLTYRHKKHAVMEIRH